MEPRLNFESLTYDGVGDFISSAVEKSEAAPLYLLDKAAAYVDIVLALGRISRPVASELRTIIIIYAGMAEAKPAECWGGGTVNGPRTLDSKSNSFWRVCCGRRFRLNSPPRLALR